MSVLGRQVNRSLRAITTSSILTITVVYLAIALGHLTLPVVSQLNAASDTNQSQVPSISLSATTIITDLNEERHSAGLPSVIEDPRLDSSATQKAAELAQTGWNSDIEANHINPTTGAQGYTYALNAAHCSYAAENLSYLNNTSQSVVDAWKASAAHLAAMNGDYQTAGVGINGSYVTLHLCRSS